MHVFTLPSVRSAECCLLINAHVCFSVRVFECACVYLYVGMFMCFLCVFVDEGICLQYIFVCMCLVCVCRTMLRGQEQ